MRCFDDALLRAPLNEVCRSQEIGSVPRTNGKPSSAPAPDQLPFSYDPSTGILWFHTDGWKGFGINALNPVNLANITNLDNVLRVPVTYVSGNQQVEGYVTLRELKTLLNGD